VNSFPELTLDDFKDVESPKSGGMPELTLEDFGIEGGDTDASKTRTETKAGSKGASPELDTGTQGQVRVRDTSQDGLETVNPEEGSVGDPFLDLSNRIENSPIGNYVGAIADLIVGTPKFIGVKLPQYAFEGAKVASGNETIGHAIGSLLKEAVPQGREIARGFQEPVGSKPFASSVIQSLMLGAPGLELVKGVKPKVEIPLRDIEKPPVQEAVAAEKPPIQIEEPTAIPPTEKKPPVQEEPVSDEFPQLTEEDFAGPAITEDVLKQMDEEQPALFFSQEKPQELTVEKTPSESDIESGETNAGLGTEREGIGIEEQPRTEGIESGTETGAAPEMAPGLGTGGQALEGAHRQAYELSQHIGERVAVGQPDSVIEAAQAAAFDNARGSLSSTGAFNQDFMVKSAMRAAGRERARLAESMDKPIGEGESDTLHDIIPSDQIPPDQAVAKNDRNNRVNKLLSELPEREQAIVRGVSMEGKTIEQVGAELGISHQRVSQLHARALDTLRKRMTETEEGLRLSKGNLAETEGDVYLLPRELREAFTPKDTKSRLLDAIQKHLGATARIRSVGLSSERLSALGPTRDTAKLASQVSKAERLANKLGLKVNWFRSDVPIQEAGAHLSGVREIAINVDALRNNDPVHIIAAHEVGHGLKTLHPELWRDLANEIRDNARSNPEALKAFNDRLRANGYKESQLLDELVSDVVADVLKNPGRFAEAMGAQPRLVARVMAAIHDILARITNRLRGAPETKTTSAMAGEAMGDIKAMRQSVMDAFRKANDKAQALDIVSEAQGLDLAMKKGKLDPTNPLARTVNLNREIREGSDVDTKALIYAERKANDFRMEFNRDAKDLHAMEYMVDEGRNLENLQKARELIETSKSKAPFVKEELDAVNHAIDNFDRLSKTPTSYDSVLQRQSQLENMTGAARHGTVDNYVSHFFEEFPEEKNSFMGWFDQMSRGPRMSRYFTKNRTFKTRAEAIHEGFKPLTKNLADNAQVRLATGQRLILQQKFIDDMTRMRTDKGFQPVYRTLKDSPRGYEPVKLSNGVTVYAHPEFHDLLKSLYSDSVIRQYRAGRAALKTSAVLKTVSLGIDTFHAFQVAFRNLAASKGMTRLGYKKGLGLLEYSKEGIQTALERKEITPAIAKYATDNRVLANKLISLGAQVGRWSDNLLGEARFHFPGLSKATEWIFQKEARGMLMQALVENAKRNMRRFPELGEREALKRTVREMNDEFGNSRVLRSATLRDMAQLTFLAPTWWITQLRSELRAYKQLGQVPVDVLRGKGLRMGTVAQAKATGLLATFMAYQAANYLTTGHSTLGNEKGHKLDLYLPIGRGLFISPFTTWFKYADQLVRLITEQGKSVPGAVGTMLGYKFHRLPQALYTLFTGRATFGPQPKTPGGVYRASLAEAIPIPMQFSGVIKQDPNSMIGYGFNVPFTKNTQWDEITKQALSGIGQHATIERPPTMIRTPARSPRTRPSRRRVRRY